MAFAGVTASPSYVLIRGSADKALNEIPDQLRAGFKQSNPQHSIDPRYSIRTAHSTIVRFKKILSPSRIV